MGILDDAIRQHLELKRSLGADDDELKQLEDEAFGPPARPGDPDFPDSEAGDAEGSNGLDAGVDAPSDTGDASVQEAPSTGDVATLAEEPEPEPDTPAPGAVFDHASGEPEEVEEEEPAAQAEPDEPEQLAVPEEPEPEEAEPEPDTEAPEPAPAAETSEPPLAAEDQIPASEDLDLGELDLDIEDDELLRLDPDPPVESLETVEHPIAPETGEHEDVGEEEEDDDVLADTPEFLRDAPEDDDLWFEQGKPKDFDFDE
ncbi:MAG: hypothetical protein QOJ01_1535 [Solirubrobacterales bacterium]|jgi:hypothetical protein|nr:hypothetical protein [Solirubrobacterales bacterium]